LPDDPPLAAVDVARATRDADVIDLLRPTRKKSAPFRLPTPDERADEQSVLGEMIGK
jgi:hypothetical protein